MDTIIKTKDLTKNYGEKKAADQININVQKGDIYGLIVRNGAGKTTLLKMIAGLIYQNSGSIELNFDDKSRKNNIGILIESPGLMFEFDGKTNINLKMTALGIRRKGYEEELLELVGLKGVKKKVKEYSLGMKQRLGLALALIGDPELLILDEPSNGMDPQGMQDFRNLIQKLAKEKDITIIISSHILDELAKFATRFGIIDHGKMITEISAEELNKVDADRIVIKTDKTDEVMDLLVKSFNPSKTEVDNQGTIYIYDKLDTREINEMLASKGIIVSEIYTAHQSLEHYYLNLTGGSHV